MVEYQEGAGLVYAKRTLPWLCEIASTAMAATITTVTRPLIGSTTAEGSLLLTTYIIIYNYILADHHDVRHVLLS